MPETVLSPVRGKCFHLPLPESMNDTIGERMEIINWLHYDSN